MPSSAPSFVRNPDFIFRKIVEETILVPVYQNVSDMECIYTLNELGAFLWERMAEPVLLADLEAAIQEEYDVEAPAVSEDLDVFLQQMLEIGAVKRI